MTASNTARIVLLPGMDGTGELLAPLHDQLVKHRPVTVISYPRDRFLDYEQLAATILERLPAEPFFLLGESFSGPLAIEIAARTGIPAAGLILAATFAKHPWPSVFAGLTPFVPISSLPSGLHHAALLGNSGTAELRRDLARVLNTIPDDVLRRRLAAVLRVDKTNQLRSVPLPVLCLAGRRDRLFGTSCVKHITATRPDREMVWLDGPHMFLETHPEQSAHAIEAFCSRLEKSPRLSS